MGLCLFFLSNFSGATFIQGGTFIPDSRVNGCKHTFFSKIKIRDTDQKGDCCHKMVDGTEF